MSRSRHGRYIAKPVKINELVEILEKYLGLEVPEIQTCLGLSPMYRSSMIANKRLRGRRRSSSPTYWRSIKLRDPDVILFPYADTWVPLIVKKARRYGLEPTFSSIGWVKGVLMAFRTLAKPNLPFHSWHCSYATTRSGGLLGLADIVSVNLWSARRFYSIKALNRSPLGTHPFLHDRSTSLIAP